MRNSIIVLLLSFPMLAATARSQAAESYWRADQQWAADRDAASHAVWKDTWDATFNANRERWTQEVAAGDKRTAESHLRMRMALLLEAMLGSKLPQTAEIRNNAMGELAEHLSRAGYFQAANAYRKRIIDENPGDAELALKTLNQILASVRYEDDDRWTEYASDRYMAINRLGRVPDGDHGFIEAIKSRAVFDRTRGEFLQAARDLELLKARLENSTWWRTEQANLLAAAGHAEEALPMYEKVLAESEPNIRQEIRSHMAAIGQNQMFSATKFGGDEVLRTRWANLRDRESMDLAGDLDALLAADVARMNLVPEADGAIDSLWTSVDRFTRSAIVKNPAAARPLRESHAAEAQSRLEAARAGGRTDDLLAVFRRYPWTPAGHAALADLADAYLRGGQPALAMRCYADLLDHADDAGFRGVARSGIWTALAQQPVDRVALDAAFKDVPEGEQFPWFGSKVAAGAIRQRVMDAAAGNVTAPNASPVAMSQRQLRPMHLPAAAAWPGPLFEAIPQEALGSPKGPATSIQMAGDRLLVAGPCLLACYGKDLAKPSWIRQSPSYNGMRNSTGEPDYFSMPGPFRPVVDGGRVVTRWGLDATERYLTSVAAFDLQSGRLAWSTADDPVLRGFWPLADPTLAEGRLYILARARAGYAAACPTALLCVDARSGKLIWQRAIAELTLTLGVDGPSRRKRSDDDQPDHIDLASYGNALTVRDGYIYCSTSMGVVACCDGRDGSIEWARPYPRSYLGKTLATLVGRDGSSPVLCGDKVIFQPRDCWGVFALEQRTGRICWANPLLPCREVVGAIDRNLVLRGERTLLAVDMEDGSLLWERPLPQPAPTRTWIEGQDVLLLCGNTLQRLSAMTGNTIEQRAELAAEPVREIGFCGSTLVLASDAPSAVDAVPPAQPAAPAAGLPTRHLWSVSRSDPRFYLPGTEAKMGARVFVVSSGVLDCVPTAAGIAPWQRPLEPGTTEVLLGQGLVLLVYADRLVAVDGTTGIVRWRVHTEFAADFAAITETCVVICDRDRRRFTAAAYDSATGRLLWDRELPSSFSPLYWSGPRGAQAVGNNLYAIGMQQGQREEAWVWTLQCADGAITARRPLLPPNSGGTRHVAMDGPWGCAQIQASNEWRYGWFNLLDAAPPEDARIVGAPKHAPWGYSAFHVFGELLQIEQSGSSDLTNFYTLPLRGSATALRNSGPGFVRGERFYVIANSTIKAVNLKTQTSVAQYALPLHPEPGETPTLMDLSVGGSTLLVVSAIEHRDPPPDNRRVNPRRRVRVAQARGEMSSPRIDAFDLASGNHLLGADLGEMEFWKLEETGARAGKSTPQAQALITGDLLLIADLHGVHAYGPSAPTPATDAKPSELVSYRRQVPAPATQPAEVRWPLTAVASANASTRPEGNVQVSHDDDDLFITVTYRDDAITPRHGRREYSTGDWLEIGLTTNLGFCRFGVGVDELCRNVWENLCSGPLPQRMRCVVRQDLARSEHIYEISIPLREVLQKSSGSAWRRIGLSLNIWEDNGSVGSRPILRFADEQDPGDGIAARGRGVHLYPFSADEDLAAAAIIQRLGDLPEARALAESLQRPAPATLPSNVAPVAPADALAFLETQVPRLGSTDAAMSFFKAMLRLEGSDGVRIVSRYKWFLKTLATQPRATEVLGDLLAYRRKTVWQSDNFMDAVMEECKIPLRTRYDYRRRYLQPKKQFLTAWQVIGPFANTDGRGLESPYPPEIERIHLDAAYPGVVDQVRWRTVDVTKQGSLTRALRLNDANIMYLACWIKNPTARGATLELAADDGVKVWLNRRMIYSGPDTDGHTTHRAAVYLSAGWNELLVKVAKNAGEWEFRAELVDSEGRGPLSDVQINTTPP